VIRLVGGEMAEWTEERPPAGGALHAHLAGLLPAEAEVLVAGPHEHALVEALARHASVTCLVRSQLEAAELDARGVRVLCGTLAKLTDADRFDVVVALDGVDRLCSVEGPQLDWAESLQALKRALRPGGTLLLAVENELGLHRLVDTATATSAPTAGTWRALGEFDASKPGSPVRLTERLAAEGLAVDWLGACWPLPGSPTMIATPEALNHGPADALAAAAASAAGAAYAGKSVLSDPRRLAAAAVRGGLGPELAAAWLVAAHLPAGSAAVPALPAVLIGDGVAGAGLVVEVAPGPDGEWTRRVVHGAAGRDAAGLDGPLPAGRLLEELLIGAALRHDLPVLRRLLTGWVAVLPDATADNVVVHDDVFTKLDPSVPAQADVLRRFARTLLAGGYTHPWPAATDLRALTATLHTAAGLPGEPDVPDGDDPPLPDSRRELEEQLRALRRELAEAAARDQWYERELGKRERELNKARKQIASFSGTIGFRVAKLGYGVARKARNRLRKGHK
jgi:SAM-dependent methyltransferase